MSIKYSNHFLKHVIFQANFSLPTLKTHLDNSIKDLCQEITGQTIQEAKNANINVSPNQPISTEMSSRWLFLGTSIQITIQHDLFQIINLSYTDYIHFHEIIERVFNKFREIYNPNFSRIALRYTNNINLEEGSTFDFKGLIDENIINSLTMFKDEGLQRSVGQMVMRDDNDLSTLFTYGFSNSQFPAKIIKREFLLDFDCSINFTQPTNDIISVGEILLKIRNKVNHLFEKSILDGLREKMYGQTTV